MRGTKKVNICTAEVAVTAAVLQFHHSVSAVYLVYELGVVVCDSVQAGVAEGAGQSGVSAQRGAAVGGEQTQIHPQNRLHEGQH